MKTSYCALMGVTVCVAIIMMASVCLAAVQEEFFLPLPYYTWERAYLYQFRDLQRYKEIMISIAAQQLPNPSEDILHNRICAAWAYQLSQGLSSQERRLAVITDILHNISKEDKSAVLTDPQVFTRIGEMVTRLKRAGHFRSSPDFWGDASVLQNAKVGGNRALIHHITGALKAEQIAAGIGGLTEKEIMEMQAAIIEHSTGYWYFRDSVDKAVGRKGAWKAVYPEPTGEISKIAHDADLISQFVPESVVPEGSKWRELAKKRWGAKNAREEGHIVYYVFLRLFEEAKTTKGMEMAREKWEKIKPELVKLIGLEPGQDPIKVLGVPQVFQ